MKSLEERLNQAKKRVKELEAQKRVQEKQKLDAQMKIIQRRNYIVGEIVCKYFPQLLVLTPGTKQENVETFKDFEQFLIYLTEEKELCKQVFEKFNSSRGISSVVRQDNPSNNSEK